MTKPFQNQRAIKWSIPPDSPELKAGNIDIWRLPLDKLPCRPELLEPTELGRLNNYRHESGRRQYCASRTALRTTLGKYLRCRASEVPLVIKQGGKPRLAPEPPPLYFNLSHADGTALLAVCADHKVGVDIEILREIPEIKGIAKRIFSAAELATLEQADWRPTVFYRLWTELEARQKCLGRGVFGAAVQKDAVASHTFSLDADQYAAVAWPGKFSEPEIRFYTL